MTAVDELVAQWTAIVARAKATPTNSSDVTVETLMDEMNELMARTQAAIPALATPLGMIFHGEEVRPVVSILADVFPELLRLRVLERRGQRSIIDDDLDTVFDEFEERQRSDRQMAPAYTDVTVFQEKKWLN